MSKLQIKQLNDDTAVLVGTRGEFDELEKQYGADALIAFKQLIQSVTYRHAYNVPELVQQIDAILVKRACAVFEATSENEDTIHAYEQKDAIRIFKSHLYYNDKNNS